MRKPILFSSLDSSSKAYSHLQEHISYTQEEVWVICLNSLKHPLKSQKIFMGSVDQVLIHPREIFKTVILSQSSSFILCHSHPSGDPTPSDQDIFITKKIFYLASLMEIPLCDHIIFSISSYFSFIDKSLEPFGRDDF